MHIAHIPTENRETGNQGLVNFARKMEDREILGNWKKCLIKSQNLSSQKTTKLSPNLHIFGLKIRALIEIEIDIFS